MSGRRKKTPEPSSPPKSAKPQPKEEEEKRQKRLQRNRLSAAQHREKQRLYREALEAHIKHLTNERDVLKALLHQAHQSCSCSAVTDQMLATAASHTSPAPPTPPPTGRGNGKRSTAKDRTPASAPSVPAAVPPPAPIAAAATTTVAAAAAAAAAPTTTAVPVAPSRKNLASSPAGGVQASSALKRVKTEAAAAAAAVSPVVVVPTSAGSCGGDTESIGSRPGSASTLSSGLPKDPVDSLMGTNVIDELLHGGLALDLDSLDSFDMLENLPELEAAGSLSGASSVPSPVDSPSSSQKATPQDGGASNSGSTATGGPHPARSMLMFGFVFVLGLFMGPLTALLGSMGTGSTGVPTSWAGASSGDVLSSVPSLHQQLGAGAAGSSIVRSGGRSLTSVQDVVDALSAMTPMTTGGGGNSGKTRPTPTLSSVGTGDVPPLGLVEGRNLSVPFPLLSVPVAPPAPVAQRTVSNALSLIHPGVCPSTASSSLPSRSAVASSALVIRSPQPDATAAAAAATAAASNLRGSAVSDMALVDAGSRFGKVVAQSLGQRGVVPHSKLADIPGYDRLSSALQTYANAALMSYTAEMFNSTGSGRPGPPANASYVMCPEAVGFLSEALRGGSQPQSPASPATPASASASAGPGSPVPIHTSAKAGSVPGAAPGSPDAAVADLPYMMLLTPASSISGLDQLAPEWERPATSTHGSPRGSNTGWVEIGCNIASVRRVHSVELHS